MTVGAEFEFAGTKQFEIKRKLGAGGMGVVYEALDREKNATVALKTLKHVDAQALYRLKNEFRALQDLEHPNLVSLGELVGGDEGAALITQAETWAESEKVVNPDRATEILAPGLRRPAR